MSTAPAHTGPRHIGPRHIGVDFDNTIVLYDAVFAAVGADMGLLPPGFTGSKAAVRAHVQALEGGFPKWTALQARVYGPGIARAVPAPGLFDVLDRLNAAGCRLSIVSHKTEYAAADPGGANLRDAARAWIGTHDLTGRHGIAPDDIHFLSTRAEKLARIRDIGCTDFIDDLVEVFEEPDFPAGVRRYLFAPGGGAVPGAGYAAFAHWREIGDALLGRHAA